MRASIVAFAAISAVAVNAAETPAQLAAQIPSCALPCDKAAIAKVGCGETEYSCHCAHSSQLQALILPCLQNTSNCTTGELTTFGTLVTEICENLNVTANGTNSSAPSATGAPTSSSTPTGIVPYTGAGSLAGVSKGLFALIGAAAFGFVL